MFDIFMHAAGVIVVWITPPLYIIGSIMIAVAYRDRGLRRYPILLFSLANIYYLGELLQELELGVYWLRWYLSDVGGPVNMAAFMYALAYRFVKDGFCGHLRLQRNLVIAALAFAMAHELAGRIALSVTTWRLVRTAPADPVDLLAYCLGASMALFVIRRWHVAYQDRVRPKDHPAQATCAL